jgi:hypothetical protein
MPLHIRFFFLDSKDMFRQFIVQIILKRLKYLVTWVYVILLLKETTSLQCAQKCMKTNLPSIN